MDLNKLNMFSDDLALMAEHGCKPCAVALTGNLKAFVFENEDQANVAWEKFGRSLGGTPNVRLIAALWYDKEETDFKNGEFSYLHWLVYQTPENSAENQTT